MIEDLHPELDRRFLQVSGISPEMRKKIQSFYLPMFEGCSKVVDLACGDGEFIGLLEEQSQKTIGVCSDPALTEEIRGRGLSVVCQDALTYLQESAPGGVDGIFAPHLVERMSHQAVWRLFRLSAEVLRPGGILIATTTNVRGLASHLETFWSHYGYVSFYHPRLLCALMEQAGLVHTASGENEAAESPLMSGLRACFLGDLFEKIDPATEWLVSSEPADKKPSIHQGWNAWVHRFSQGIRMILARFFLPPYLGQLMMMNAAVKRLEDRYEYLAAAMLRMDRPLECYAIAQKPDDA